MQPSGHVSIFAHAGLELVGIEMQRGLSAMSSGMKAEKPLKLRASHSAIAFIPPMRNTICIRFPKIFINSSEVCPEVHRLSSWQTAQEQRESIEPRRASSSASQHVSSLSCGATHLRSAVRTQLPPSRGRSYLPTLSAECLAEIASGHGGNIMPFSINRDRNKKGKALALSCAG
jgi:hypothetical protein